MSESNVISFDDEPVKVFSYPPALGLASFDPAALSIKVEFFIMILDISADKWSQVD
jgi:hypothetical protein